MANLAQPQTAAPQKEVLDDDAADSSYEIALNTMTALFYDKEHMGPLLQAVQQSKDPSKVVGNAIGQIAILAYNKLNKADVGIDDRVWASEEGALDGLIGDVIPYFQEEGIELNPETVVSSVANVLKDSPVPGDGQEQAPPQAPPQQAPQQGLAAPQQGAPV